MSNDRRRDDATALLALLEHGDVSPQEATAAAIQRCTALNPTLNAVIHEDFERAVGRAERPLDGVLAGLPVAVKDLGCDQAGRPHHHGARFLKELSWTATDDSYLWKTLAEAGSISIGRTNTPEFGSTITTEPLAYGPTRNPWNLGHSPGGSSGGSAAAVAAGIVTMAHGNDGGGSIRIPASACGLVGLKPTRGRVSTGPHRGEHRGGFAVDGMLTKTVRDAALALDVLSRRWPGEVVPVAPPELAWSTSHRRDPGSLRVGVAFGRSHDECRTAVDHVASLLSDLGHSVGESVPRDWFDAEVTDQTIVIRTVNMAAELDAWAAAIGRPLTEDDVEDSNYWSAELGRTLSGTMYADAQAWLARWSREVARFWEQHDVLLTPVLGAPPPPIGHLSDPVEGQVRLRELIGFVDQANVSGQPAISVPTHLSAEGLPIGVQLIAAHGREDLLLQVAAQLETNESFISIPDLADKW